ncbi:MAG: hypothetical protein HY811_08155 [Planctomycetes bacterium]|nr:hypothetical protein [Planctomycetota bacterium]
MVRFSDIFKKKNEAPDTKPLPAQTQPLPQSPPTPEPKPEQPKSSSQPQPPPSTPSIPQRIRVIRVDKNALENTDTKRREAGAPAKLRENIKSKEEIIPATKDGEKNTPVSFAKAMFQPPQTPTTPKTNYPPADGISLAEIVRQRDAAKPELAGQLYNEACDNINKIITQVKKTDDFVKSYYDELAKTTNEIIKLIFSENQNLLDMAYRYSPEEYMKYHLTNAGIISLYLGREMGYEKVELTELGMLSFLHELEITEASAESGENPDVKLPIKVRLFLLQKMYARYALPASVKTGYELEDYIKIIQLADIYETLCRPSPYRKGKLPQIVIKELIEAGEVDKALLKTLIKLVGIYPAGTWVRLSTNEIGQVTCVNRKYPLRPVVSIIIDESKRQIAQPKTLDLSSNQNVYIQSALTEDELRDHPEK